jgi:hypothetical protein
MSIDLETAYKSKTTSIYKYLGSTDAAFIIPVYQRDYAWDQQQVKDLIEDIVDGISTIYTKREINYCSYIGTVITADGIDISISNKSIELPGNTWSIVDGQQRISSISLLALAILIQLDEALLKAKKICEKSSNENLSKLIKWLTDETRRLDKLLRWRFFDSTVEIFAPKIIRANSDSWTTEADSYRSPIPHLVMRYFKLREEGNLSQFNRIRNPPSWPKGQKNFENERFSNIHSNIQSFVAGSEVDSWFDGLPSSEELLSNLDINIKFLNKEIFPDDGLTEAEYLYFSNIRRLLVFSTYFLDRVAFTVVKGMTEDVAFEVFESLNTSGTPLGPYETFKPRVIRLINPKSYPLSREKAYLDKIDGQLRLPNTQLQKTKLAIDSIINFSMGFDGKPVSKRLADQVYRLRETFDPVSNDQNLRLKFLHLFWNSTEISYIFWLKNFNDNSEFEALIGGHDDVMLCCQFLADIRHTIVHPLITRFYSDFLESNYLNSENHCSAEEVRSVIKAVTAFSVLWRAAWGGTAGIDSMYRKLMSSSFNKSISSDRRITVGELKTLLKKLLFETKAAQRGAIKNQHNWRDLARTSLIYTQADLCKFLLLAAQHDCVPDTSNAGLIKNGALNSHSCWSRANFQNSDNWIEHIAPATPIDGQWNKDIYEDIRFKDRLGNLVVMPKLDNILAGNQPWENKRKIYEFLTESDLSVREAKIKKSGLALTNHQKSLLMESEYQPALKSIILRKQWDKDFINRRTDRLLDLAWDRIYAWLN